MTTSRFSVEIDSTGDPAVLLAELRRICDLSFTTSRVQRTITSTAGTFDSVAATGTVAASRSVAALKRKLESMLPPTGCG